MTHEIGVGVLIRLKGYLAFLIAIVSATTSHTIDRSNSLLSFAIQCLSIDAAYSRFTMRSFTFLPLAFTYHILAAPLSEPLGVNTPENQTAATIGRREVLQPLKGSDFTEKEGEYAALVAVPMWLFAKNGLGVCRHTVGFFTRG